jgi:hypothetical protein
MRRLPNVLTLAADEWRALDEALENLIELDSGARAARQLTQAAAAAIQRTRGALDGAGDRRVEIAAGVFHDHVGLTRQLQLDAAALVDAAAAAVEVGESNHDALHAVADASQREVQTALQMGAETFGEFESMGAGVDVHDDGLLSGSGMDREQE